MQTLDKPIQWFGVGVGLIISLLIVYSEQAEFNDFPLPGLVSLSYAICLGLVAYYSYLSLYSWLPPLIFILFFQATAVRSGDYRAFTQAHVLTILFLGWLIYQQRHFLVNNKPLMVIYGVSILSSLAIILYSI
jgi:hypothetical protein